jgi:hypothetical protein
MDAWNDELQRFTFQDVPLGFQTIPNVWIVRTGSGDEIDVNDLVAGLGYTFSGPCDHPDAWASLRYARPMIVAGHTHARYQKICWYGTDSAPNALNSFNSQGAFHYWTLTFMHELAHALSFPDLYTDPQSCLMRSDVSMLYLCSTERSWVKAHYGAAGGY